MKKSLFNLLAAAAVAVAMSACDDGANKMTMTLQPDGKATIFLSGAGEATVKWGDGAKETRELSENRTAFTHTYSDASARTITVSGYV